MISLPRGWRWTTVGNAGRVDLGRQRHPDWHVGPEMRPYLRVANVFEDRIDSSDLKHMDFSGGAFARYKLEPGDVLLNEGQSPELLGRSAIYRGLPEDVAFTNTLLRFRPHSDITSAWALLVFRHYMHSGRFVREARITTNIAHLSATRLKQVEFPVPPLDEQRRIVDIVEDHLSRLDAADVQLSRCLRRIKVMTSATMQAVSDGPLRPLSEVASIGGGIQKQAKRRPVLNRAPFLRVANVTKDGLNLAQVHEVELFPGELDRYRLEAGDLLVVEGNGSPEQIGRAALWDGSIPDAVHQNHLIRVRPGPDVLPEYLEIIWNSPSIRESVRRLASSSSGLHTLSVKKLSRVLVPVSGITSQRQAVVRVGDLREKGERLASAIRVQKRRSFSLRRAFLAAAFSGQLTESAYRMNLIEETAARGLV